jgi:Pretoxin HINT domain
MFSAVLLTLAMLGADDPTVTTPAASRPPLEIYQSESAKAGKTADAHIRLALWCESHGLTAERLKHLSLAVLYDPANTLARGLMGLVGYQGKWDRPDVIGREIQEDPAHQALVREYLDRRARTPYKGDAQMKLAAWCEEKGLKEQAIAHYTAVTRIDPSRETAWRHLGYKKQGNRWVKPDELAAAKQEATHQKTADKHWKPRLEKLREALASKDTAKRAKADQALTEVTDPRAVPMIWALFVRGGEREQMAAVQMFGQIDGPSASNGLAALAAFSPTKDVRRRAIATLVRRDPRDVVGKLIGLVKKPYKYQVRPINGPGSPGELFVEGERFNIQRIYSLSVGSPILAMGRIFTPDMPFDPFNVRNLILATVPNHITNVSAPVSPDRVTSSYPFPLSPQSTALAAQAMAANPQNASAILNQLISSPANRYAPAGYWFYPTQPNGVSSFVPVTQPGIQNGPASASTMQGMAQRLAVQNQAAINQLRATQQNPNNLLHQAANVKRLESNPANFQAGIIQDGMDTVQAMAIQRDYMIGLELERIRQANLNLEQRLAMDTQYVEALNTGINLCNDNVLPVLTAITGQDLGAEPEKWKSWWVDQIGYAYESNVPETKPTFTDFVVDGVQPVHNACFAVGTPVQTIDGPRPIESIRLGDRVLSQGTASGQLAFQPVTATHRNPPAATFRIAIGGESIVATGIHRFWKAGKGWTMARELKAGDHLRMVGGTVTIESIEADKTQPVYNLEVAQNRNFFVGSRGLLVHDFSFVQPVAEPFDREPELGSGASASK